MPSDIHQFNEAAAGAFAAVYQGVKDFRKELAKAKSPTELKKSSIMRAQKDLVASFPVFCSDTVSPNVAMLVTKAVESNARTSLQLLLTASHLKGSNVMDVLGQFHTNMDNQMDMSDYMDYAAAAVRNANNYKVGGSAVRAADSFFRMGSFGEAAKQEFLESCRHFYPESSTSERSLNDYIVSEGYGGYDVREYMGSDKYITEVKQGGNKKTNVDDATEEDWNKKIRDDNDNAYMTQKDLANLKMQQASLGISNAKNQLEREKLMHQIDNDMQNARHNYITKQLLPTDVQKINELVPSLMVVRFAVDDEKSVETVHEAVIGVKARLIAIPSEDVMEQIGNYKKGGINQLNLARATTKEIAFGKDFVAAIQDAKIEAKRDTLGNRSAIWRSLQGRSSSSNIRRLAHARNTAAAISTLVLTQPEADYIKTNYRVAIDTVNEATAFMAKFNFMGLVIVDEQAEIAKFIFDSDRYFTQYTLTALDRQTKSMLDNQITNLIVKSNR